MGFFAKRKQQKQLKKAAASMGAVQHLVETGLVKIKPKQLKAQISETIWEDRTPSYKENAVRNIALYTWHKSWANKTPAQIEKEVVQLELSSFSGELLAKVHGEKTEIIN